MVHTHGRYALSLLILPCYFRLVTRQRLLNAGSNWLAFALTLLVAFLLTPHLIRSLGPARYDVWCVVEAILAYFTLLDLGVGVGLVRAAARSRQQPDELNRIASASVAVFSFAGLVALAIGIPLTLLLAPTIGERAGDPRDATLFMLLMLLNLALALPLSALGSILEGREAFVGRSAIRVAALLLKAGGYVAVTWSGHSLVPLALVSLIVTALESLGLFALVFHIVPTLTLRRSLIDRATLREVRGQSWHAFLVMLAGRITMQTAVIAVGLALPAGLATAFATAARLVDYAKTLLRTITATLTPGIAAMEVAGDWAGIRRLILTTTTVTISLALPINLGLIAFGHPFLVRWVGSEIADRAYPPLVILSATLAIGVVQSVASRVLYGLGRLRWFARLAMLESVVNVLLTIVLIRDFDLVGVAVAVAVPNGLLCFATIGIAMRLSGIEAWSAARSIVVPLAMSAIPLTMWLLLGPATADYGAILLRAGSGYGLYLVAVGALELMFRHPIRPPVRTSRYDPHGRPAFSGRSVQTS